MELQRASTRLLFSIAKFWFKASEDIYGDDEKRSEEQDSQRRIKYTKPTLSEIFIMSQLHSEELTAEGKGNAQSYQEIQELVLVSP